MNFSKSAQLQASFIKCLCLVKIVLIASFTSAQTAVPPDKEYVTVQDGHLSADGKRVRLWCAIGSFPNPSNIQPSDSESVKTQKRDRAYKDADAILNRFTALGFNGMRMWARDPQDYVKGDGSQADVIDYFVSRAKEKGFRIWVPAVSVANIVEEDAGLVPDKATEPAWRAAIKESKGDCAIARVWDPRLEAAQLKAMSKITNHVNRHTGLRWGDDPVFSIWELTNEEWWMMKMVGGQWQNLPPFFKDSLTKKWQQFLKDKYGDEQQLVSAWGFLLPGESVEKGTVQIAPLASGIDQDTSGMDPQARQQVEAARLRNPGKLTRDSFTRQRGADVLEFFLSIQLAHKTRLKVALKAMGKSCKMSPVVYDTGIGYEIQSQFIQQNAEAVAHDAYINGFTNNTLNPRYPWYSGLEEWPKISQDVPWLEHNRTPGKPYLCYETQIMQPGKYRAEFPLRILALAAIQDWDAVCWHYWGGVDDISTNPKPFDKPMDVTFGWHPQGYHYTYDAVQNGMMRAAAYAFRNKLLDPAPNPTLFVYGKKSLFEPASMDYGGSYGKTGMFLLPTTYANGVRIKIDPSSMEDKIEGPTVNPISNTLPNILKSTRQITWDIGRGGLIMDAPGTVAFTGFFTKFGSSHRFSNGVVLDKIEVQVPKDMPYSEGLREEKYIGFQIASHDGLPLATTKSATLVLQSSSFNSGFKMLWKPGQLAEPGTLPVATARVSATVRGAALVGMKYRFLDWNLGVLQTGAIAKDGVLKIPSNLPIWIVELTR